MSAITTVIFDMFNTIAQDGPELWRQSFVDIIEGQELDTTPEALRNAWDSGSDNFRARRIDPDVPFISYLDGWADAFANAFNDLNLSGNPMAASQKSIDDLGTRPLFSDVPEALSILGQARRLAVLSNADDAYLNPVVERIPANFAAVVSSERGRSYKPDARLFELALHELRAAPSECVYVGDKQFEDVKGARGAGMSVVWINRKGEPLNPDLPTPDAEIRTLAELPDVLERLDHPRHSRESGNPE